MGDGYLVYGNSPCMQCGSVHGPDYQIRETQRSRVRALRLCAELATIGLENRGATRWDEMGPNIKPPTRAEKLAALRTPGHASATPARKPVEKLAALKSLRGGRVAPKLLGYPDALVKEHRGDPMMFGGQRAPGGKDAFDQVSRDAELRDQVIAFFAGHMHVSLEPTIDNMVGYYRMDRKDASRVQKLAKRMVEEGLLAQIGNQFHYSGHDVVMGTPVSARMPVIQGSPNTSFMIGVLICGNVTYAAASGPANNSGPFKAIMDRRRYRACKPRSADGPAVNKNISGQIIPRERYAAAQDNSASPPGNCAAPRLIQEAMENALVRVQWRTWEMSEVWYFPANDPTAKGAHDLYTHGLSAYHCKTCEKLVPLLMHDGSEVREGVGTASTLTQEAMRRSRPAPPGRRRRM